jgi:hypothetical protein
MLGPKWVEGQILYKLIMNLNCNHGELGGKSHTSSGVAAGHMGAGLVGRVDGLDIRLGLCEMGLLV